MKRLLGWAVAIAIVWTLFHNGVLMVVGTRGILHYSREAFLLLLALIAVPVALHSLPSMGLAQKACVGVALLTMTVCTVLLFVPNAVMTLAERVKGWYGFCAPFGIAVLMIGLRIGREQVMGNLAKILAIGLVFAIGIIADGFLGLRFQVDVMEAYGAKYAQGAYRASFIIDSPMGAGYLTASGVVLAVLVLTKEHSGWFVRFLALLSVALGIAANLACLSRGGTAILCGTLAVAWFMGGKLRLGHVVAIFLLVTLMAVFLRALPAARNWIGLTFDFQSEASNVSREQAWEHGLNMAHDSGWTGYGLGITRDAELRDLYNISNGENTLLHAWLEGGLLLFGCFAAWLVVWLGLILQGALRVLRRRDFYLAAVAGINLMTWVYSFVFPIMFERTTSLLASCWFALLMVELSEGPRRLMIEETTQGLDDADTFEERLAYGHDDATRVAEGL